MKLRALNLKWALAFAGAVVAGAVGVMLVLTLVGNGDEQATAKPVTTVTAKPEGTPHPARPIPTVYPIHVPTLAPGFVLAEKRPCPDEWQRISDDVLNYSICIPPDWGILDEETGERSTQLTWHSEGLKILSPEGFPYSVGVPLDKPLQDPDMNLVWISIGMAPPNSSMGCDTKPHAPLGLLPAMACQERFDYTDQGDVNYRPDGSMVEIEIIVPLPNPKPGPLGSRTGYGLIISVIGSQKSIGVHNNTISQILDSFEGQP